MRKKTILMKVNRILMSVCVLSFLISCADDDSTTTTTTGTDTTTTDNTDTTTTGGDDNNNNNNTGGGNDVSSETGGQWDSPVALNVAGVAGSVLPSGKVIYMQDPAQASASSLVVFDPNSPDGAKYLSNIPSDFSAGVVQLSNGNLLVAGGENDSDASLKDVGIFDYQTETYTATGSLINGRWNPTTLLAGDGRVYAFGGQIEPGGGLEGNDDSIEIYDPNSGTWTLLPSSHNMPGQYEEAFSRIHLMPDGKFFFSGHLATTSLYDPVAGSWSTVGNTVLNLDRGESGSVRLQSGEILIMGGIDMVTESGNVYATAETIDLEGSGQWTQVATMNRQRAFFDATVLPDGNVFVVGGETSDGTSTIPELYNVAANTWTDMKSHALSRFDHASALLLPDARVIVGGGDASSQNVTGLYNETGSYEIWSPYYLYSTARPVISEMPETSSYGQKITLTYSSEVAVDRVVINKSGSGTHGFTFNQISVPVTLEENTGTSASFTVSSNSNLLPPGYYMVFLMSTDNVPSVAKWIKIG